MKIVTVWGLYSNSLNYENNCSYGPVKARVSGLRKEGCKNLESMEGHEVIEYTRVYQKVICENRVIEQSAINILIKKARRERKQKIITCNEKIM